MEHRTSVKFWINKTFVCACTLSSTSNEVVSTNKQSQYQNSRNECSCSDQGHTFFLKNSRCHVRIVVGNIPIKFEVYSFNCFGALNI